MKKILQSKITTTLLAGFFLAVLFMTSRLLVEKYQVDRQIAALENRTSEIHGQNEQLSNLVDYLNTPQYREKEAREKLNLKRDGEVVVGLPKQQEDAVAVNAQTFSDTSQEPMTSESNFNKWYTYFFRNQQ